MGQPVEANVSTSHVERQNLTMRMQSRRYTRLTNAFSKKVEFHLYHQTLTKTSRGVHTTPAMVAGLTDRVWTVADILKLMEG